MKKLILILIASTWISFYLSAQSAGDYRSVGNGNWNDATKWQRYNGSSWISTTTYPGQNPGTGKVTIMSETEIMVTETVSHPLTALTVSIDDPNILPPGLLRFSAETAVSLTVSGDVIIAGELSIDNQNGAKTHELYIGRNFTNIQHYDQNCGCYAGGLNPINQDDKLGVVFNTTDPNSVIEGYPISFHDITFNGAGILVNIDMTIYGTATFINGIVKQGFLPDDGIPDDYPFFQILFHDGATVSGGSNVSYIEGQPSKYGDDPFTFPIGADGFYAPLTISALIETSHIYATYGRNVWWTQLPITDPELFSISNCEYWGVGYSIYTGHYSPFDVTVGWNSATRCGSSSYIAKVSDVVLAQMGGESWNTHEGSGTGTTANGSVTWSGVTGGGASFTLGNVGTDCRIPSGLIPSNVTLNSATVSWSALTGSVNYDVDFKARSSGVWINAATATTSTSVNLSGLSPLTTYDLRLRANCGSASSTYRLTQFTTLGCREPSGLLTTNNTHNSATLNWGAVTNALNYDVGYKRSTDISWLTAVTGTTSLTYTLNGLIGSTNYDWRVKANCNVGAGNYAQTSFTTAACNDVYETNNVSSQAKTISLGSTISAGISSPWDADWFKVTTPNNSNTTLEVTLSNLPADYDLYVYNKTLRLVGSSVNAGTANEVVIYNSNARKATYYIKVVGKNGAYNTSQCYNLLVQVSSSARSASGKSYPTNEVTDIPDKQLLYPNPASEFVYLNFNSATEGLVNILIVNSIGQLVKQHPVNTIKGHNQIKIQVADIRPGMYLLRINKGELNMTRKFVIAR